MKNNFLSKAYGGVTVARRKLNGLGLPRQWKVITSTLLLLFTFAIGNVWGALTAHTPGTYEKAIDKGGYGATIVTVAERDYEVYGFSYNSSGSKPQILWAGTSTNNASASQVLCSTLSADVQEIAGWISMSTAGKSSTYSMPSSTEFAASSVGSTGLYQMKLQGHSFTIKVKGYDQFSFLGNDNNADKSKGKYLQVTINGTDVTTGVSNSTNVRRYDLNATIESTIVITGLGGSNEHIDAFSLRLPEAPTCSTEISTQPSGATIAVGDANPELSIVATNVTSYAWKESSDGTSYDGASSLGSSASFTPSVNDAVQTKYYYCEVTSSCDGAAVSKSNIVTVNVVGAISYYTVTLNPAGGTIVDATGWTLNAGNYEKEVAEGTVLTLPTFTKTDRAFKTWRKAGPADVESPVTVTGDLTLTAVWNATVENVIYSWEGAEGGATEVGGTAVGSAENMINQESGGYYCLKVDGKADWSTTNISITLSGSEKVKTGDKIKFTAFYNKSKNGEAQAANSSLKMFTATTSGTQIFDMGNSELLPNIYGGGNDPANYTKTVPAGIDVSTVYMTRSQTGSNAWISKLQIIREVQVEEGDLLTVTLDYNDGATPNGSIMVASGQAVAQPANPTWAHHRFNGWKLGGSAYDFSSAVTTDITLVANWTQLYTITYVAGDASATGDAPTQVDKAATETFTVAANSFEVAGKDFVKWNDGTNDYAPGATYTVGTDNVVLTAQWEAQASNDATLKALSVAGLTLAPVFAAETETYTVTKEYGAADPVVGDVTATPTADGADVDVAWDGTNKKFTITVTALDNTTEKTYTITVNEAEAPKSLSRVLFSNGFDAFIDNTNHTVKAYYLSGAAEPTATTITASDGTAGALSEGKIRVTGADDSYVDYVVTLEAVTPNTTTVAEEAAAGEFAGDEAWVKNGLLVYGNAAGYSAGDKWYVNRRLTKGTDPEDDQRVIAGWVRSYFFVGNAYKFIMTVSNNTAIKYSIDGGEQVASNAATVEITLPAGNHMIEIVSNQSSGDCRLSAPKLVERPATYTVTYTAGEGTGDDVVDAFEYAAGDEVTVQANAFTAPANKKFNGWASAPAVTISEGKFEMPASNVVLTAQWKEYFTITYKDGETILGTEEVFTDATPAGIAYPSKVGYDFAGWVDGEDNPVTIASLSASTTVYAKWTADPCPTPFSLSKVVLTSATEGTVTGYNGNEYAGEKVIGGLKDDSKTADITGDAAVEHGYKLNGGGTGILFATLKKGDFQEGDRVTVGVIYQNTNRTVDAATNILTIYAGSDKDHTMEIATLTGVSDPGFYTYRLTAADVAAINAAGYKGIGVFRASDNGQNHSIYSVEIQGCRSWAEFHTLTFKNIDGTATIADESLEEGAYASTVDPAAPKIATKRFLGWAEAIDGTPVELTSYTITENKTLYAVYEDIVCPTSGTVYKFEIKDELSSENLPTSTDKDMSSYITATGDGYLTYTATANNKATINSDGTIQMKDPTAAYLKVELECALAAGDQIRAHVTNNPIRVQVGTTYDSNKDLILAKNAYEFVAITSAMEGKQVLYITRSSNGNANIADFEIYRRPALESVTVADLTVREGASVTPVMTLTPSDALVTSQVWSIVSGDDKIDIDPATGEVTGVAQGDAEIKVVLNGIPAMSATATVHVVETFVQEDVTESITWDFSKAGATSQFNEQVLANVDGVTLDASQFDGRKLVGSAQNITSPYLQGTMLTFNTTVKGLLSVRFTSGNNNPRVLKVYVGDPEVEIASWNYSGAATENKSIEVPAGKVTLRSYQGENPNNVRILRMAFQTPDHVRTEMLGNGVLGTICVPNNVPVSQAFGATFYELVGREPQYGKIAFDEIVSGELTAGKPYVFQAHGDNLTLYYGTTSVTAPVNGNGMYGTFEAITLPDDVPAIENLNDIYYFAQGALWSCVDLTSLSVPANRAYVKLSEIPDVPTQQPAPGRRRITLGVQGEQVATGLENGELNEAPRKVLINGELFILRGEKMYDAKGQLVK